MAEFFPTFDGHVEMGNPFVGRDFTVWAPPGRINSKLPRNWVPGPRLGRMQTLPPDLRKASLSKVLAVQECPAPVGRVLTINADASLDFLGMA